MNESVIFNKILKESNPRAVDEFMDYDVDPQTAWENYQQEKADDEQEEFFRQIEEEKRIKAEINAKLAANSHMFAVRKTSDMYEDSKVNTIEINSVEDLVKLSKENDNHKLILNFKKDFSDGFEREIEIYDDYRE